MAEIPKVKIAVLGGSTTIGAGFPRAYEGVKLIAENLVFDTPFGPTAPFYHAEVYGKEFLYVDFHGINKEVRNTEPDSSGERVFYVLWKAGVKKIIGTALCGSTNRLLDPGDAVIPDDFVDFTTKRPQMLMVNLQDKGMDVPRYSYRLHQPLCPTISDHLVEGATVAGFPRVFKRGIVGVAEGPRLESPAEIRLRWQNLGIDIVTMNLVPEVFFARELGACYAALELVSNYGEGLIDPRWEGNTAFRDFQKQWSRPSAEALLHAIKEMDPDDESCGCSELRWESILL
ncbi:MAG: MTAP family purine nucleoside phosphorylase [Candidatus Bathyarchaeota archaeon]|nr:MTAP family purine nucleoside phosphorylase [Candidatus Bathyarchaeota archaeon]